MSKLLIRKIIRLGGSRYVAIPPSFPKTDLVALKQIDGSFVIMPVEIRVKEG